jgi:hypothetical protein
MSDDEKETHRVRLTPAPPFRFLSESGGWVGFDEARRFPSVEAATAAAGQAVTPLGHQGDAVVETTWAGYLPE